MTTSSFLSRTTQRLFFITLVSFFFVLRLIKSCFEIARKEVRVGDMSSIFNAILRSVSGAASMASEMPEVDRKTTTEHRRTVSSPTVQPRTVTRSTSPPNHIPTAPAQDASFTSSLQTPGHNTTQSSFSSPAEILFSSSTPYIYARRKPLNEIQENKEFTETPIRFPNPANSSPYYNHPSGLVMAVTPNRPKSILSIRKPVEEEVEKKKVELTEWRKDQLRKMNPPRLIEPVVPRPIPTLHGPSSLPYARNPSGVDATIPDESANLSHIFGLRAAPESKLRVMIDPPSQSTYQPAPPRPIDNIDRKGRVEPSSIKVTREPSQSIGVRPSAPVRITAPPEKSDNKSPSTLLRAQITNALRGSKLETFPASPLLPEERVDPFQPLFENAIKASKHHPRSAVASETKIIGDIGNYPSSARYAEEAGNTTWDGSTAVGSRVPSNDTTTKGHTRQDSLVNSKADASNNWRSKTPARNSALSSITPANPSPATPASLHSDLSPVMTIDSLFEKFNAGSAGSPLAVKINPPSSVEKDLDAYIKSDSPLAKKVASSKLSLPSPAHSNISTTAERATESVPSSRDESIDSQQDENLNPSENQIKKAARVRGTPGAGKLLKRGSGRLKKEKEAEKMTPLPAKAALGAAKTVAAKPKKAVKESA